MRVCQVRAHNGAHKEDVLTMFGVWILGCSYNSAVFLLFSLVFTDVYGFRYSWISVQVVAVPQTPEWKFGVDLSMQLLFSYVLLFSLVWLQVILDHCKWLQCPKLRRRKTVGTNIRLESKRRGNIHEIKYPYFLATVWQPSLARSLWILHVSVAKPHIRKCSFKVWGQK